MKTLVYTIIFSLFFCNSIYANDGVPKIDKDAGLVAYLTQIKLQTENKMTLYLMKEHSDSVNIEAIKTYHEIKLNVDVLINKLMTDLVVKNRLGAYKKLNKYIKDNTKRLPKKIMQYEHLINQIDVAFDKLNDIKSVEKSIGKEKMSADLLGVLVNIATGIHGAITDARDFRANKIESLNSHLDKLRINNLEGKKKEEEKQ